MQPGSASENRNGIQSQGEIHSPAWLVLDLEHLHLIIIYSLTDPASSAATDHIGGLLRACVSDVYSSTY